MEILTKEEFLELQKLYCTDEKISEVLGKPIYTVGKLRRSMGIKSLFKNGIPKYTRDEILLLREEFGNDLKAGAKLGISKATFCKWRKQYEIPARVIPRTNVEEKYCLYCKQIKSLSEFDKNKRQKDGYYYCKQCKSYNHSLLKQERIKLHLCYRCGKPNDNFGVKDYCESCRIKRSEYCFTDRVRKMSLENGKKFVKRHPEKNKEYLRKRTANDPIFRLSVNLRCRLNQAIRIGAKGGSAVRDLGCSIAEFKEYIEKQFLPGMTWQNWGCGKDKWNLYHIEPFYSIDMTDREQLLPLLHFSNIRPLWQSDNVKRNIEMKNNKYVYEKVA